MLELLFPFQPFAKQVEVGEKIDGSAFRYGAESHLTLTKDGRKEALSET